MLYFWDFYDCAAAAFINWVAQSAVEQFTSQSNILSSVQLQEKVAQGYRQSRGAFLFTEILPLDISINGIIISDRQSLGSNGAERDIFIFL